MTKLMRKVTAGYKKAEETVVNGYGKIETAVVSGYRKVEKGAVEGFDRVTDSCVKALFAREGETVEQTRARLRSDRPFDN